MAPALKMLSLLAFLYRSLGAQYLATVTFLGKTRAELQRCSGERGDCMRQKKVSNQGSHTTEPVTGTIKTYFSIIKNVEFLMIHSVTINSTE